MNASDPDVDEMPWPITGDKLFATNADWWHNACLNYTCNKWDAYATGYKDAADIIVARVVETHQGMDNLVYPVAFLYRHYLELRLKEIIIHGRQLVGAPRVGKWNHDIGKLWCTARQLLEQIYPKDSKANLNIVGECIEVFCQFDLTSTNFRFPANNDDSPTLTGVNRINLRHLGEVMGRIAGLLDSASTAISEYLISHADNRDQGTD